MGPDFFSICWLALWFWVCVRFVWGSGLALGAPHGLSEESFWATPWTFLARETGAVSRIHEDPLLDRRATVFRCVFYPSVVFGGRVLAAFPLCVRSLIAWDPGLPPIGRARQTAPVS